MLFKNSSKAVQCFRVLTDVVYTVACFMQGSRIKLEADDGEYHDGEKYQQTDLQEWRHCLDDRLEHHLKTCLQKIAQE